MRHRVRKHVLRLADLVKVVSQFSRNDQETSMVVADMLNRGLVRVHSRRHEYRVAVR